MRLEARLAAVVAVLVMCGIGSALATPTGVTLSINQGAAKTGSDVVWLYMTATTGGGDMEMRFSNWGFGFSSDWQPYFQKKLWMLEPAGTLNATKGVTVEVRDDTGSVQAHDSIFVTSPLNPNVVAQKRWHYSNFTNNSVPLPGGPMGLCFDGLNLWVTRYTTDYLAKVRAPDRTVLAADYATGDQPAQAIYDGMHIWVTNWGGGTVTQYQCDGTFVRTVTVGTQPHHGVFDGNYVWVSCFDGKVYRIDAADGSVTASAVLGDDLRGMAFDGNNVWVAARGDDVVKKIRPSDFAVLATYSVGNGPEALLFDGVNIWSADIYGDTVTKLRAIDGADQGTFAVGDAPLDLAFDGAVIWVANAGSGTVSKLRAADGTPWGTISVPSTPYHLAFDGANVWVTCYGADLLVKL